MTGKTAGVILAGGQSSRMGRDKAGLDYQGQTLLDFTAKKVMESGVSELFVSGRAEGYKCLADMSPGEGPARAMLDMVDRLQGFDVAIFVPVDMPLMTSGLLRGLLREEGGFYEGHVLPLCLSLGKLSTLDQKAFDGAKVSVKMIISALGLLSLPVPDGSEGCFVNVNTPEEYKKISG